MYNNSGVHTVKPRISQFLLAIQQHCQQTTLYIKIDHTKRPHTCKECMSVQNESNINSESVLGLWLFKICILKPFMPKSTSSNRTTTIRWFLPLIPWHSVHCVETKIKLIHSRSSSCMHYCKSNAINNLFSLQLNQDLYLFPEHRGCCGATAAEMLIIWLIICLCFNCQHLNKAQSQAPIFL